MQGIAVQLLQALGELTQLVATLPTDGWAFLQVIEARGIQARQAQALVGLARLAYEQLAQGREQRFEAGQRQGGAFVVMRQADQHHFVVIAFVQRFAVEQPGFLADGLQQYRQQADALAFDLDTQFQIEPGLLGVFFDFGVPVIDLCQVELEVRLHADLPALCAQRWQMLTNKLQPGSLTGLLVSFAGAFRQRFALPQCHLQAGLFQAFAQLGFSADVTHYAQTVLGTLLDQQVLALFARGQVALVIESQCGAVLGLFLHTALARIKVHAHQAAEAQYRAGLQVFQALFAGLRAADDQWREVDALFLLVLQGE